MDSRLSQFLNEFENIKSLLRLWNLQKAEDWYRIKDAEEFDTKCIVLTPSEHDYIPNGHIENIVKIVEENSKLSWHTYHIGVTSIIVQHKEGHMISAITPQITLNFYMHDSDE